MDEAEGFSQSYLKERYNSARRRARAWLGTAVVASVALSQLEFAPSLTEYSGNIVALGGAAVLAAGAIVVGIHEANRQADLYVKLLGGENGSQDATGS